MALSVNHFEPTSATTATESHNQAKIEWYESQRETMSSSLRCELERNVLPHFRQL